LFTAGFRLKLASSTKKLLVLSLSACVFSGLSFANDKSTKADQSVEMAHDVQLQNASPGALGQAQFETFADRQSADLVSLPPLSESENQRLQYGRRQAKNPGVALVIGTARDFQMASLGAQTSAVVLTADGGDALRASVSSVGAKALRVGYRVKGSPEGITLRFGNDQGQVFEVRASDVSADELAWSPVVAGERMQIELSADAGYKVANAELQLIQMSHLDLDPALPEGAFNDSVAARIGESDSCQRDIVCRTSPPTNFRTTADAVARMVYTSGGSSFLCTGTLLNNNNTTRRHLFWSANHCISSQTVANTLQTYWFYEATTCGGTTASSRARTLSGGAFLRHNNASRDTLLLELKSAPPSGAIYAGWTSAAITSTGGSIEGIHHPSGDVKMYSLGSVTSTNGSIDGLGPFYRVRWSTGVTEGGSSGSGLFTRNSSGAYQLRGGLYGGLSFCTAPSDPDYYSKLSDVYTSVKPFLSP
jgi:lysyl endopeptidase